MLRDDEYTRLQNTLLAIAKHSQPEERHRWFALVQACQEELLTATETRAKLPRLRMSALPPKADIRERDSNFRVVPPNTSRPVEADNGLRPDAKNAPCVRAQTRQRSGQ